jgi:hypothetical protein
VKASKPHHLLTHYLKSLDLAWLEPKPCNLAIGKASLKFNALIRDRQVIANESLSVSRFMFKRRVRLPSPFGHSRIQSRHRVLWSLHGN